MRTVEFKVMDIATATEEEAEYCYVNEDTEILYEGDPLNVRHDQGMGGGQEKTVRAPATFIWAGRMHALLRDGRS